MIKFFLLDDHAAEREALRAGLISAGHVIVGEAATTIGAVEAIRAAGADLVLLDINIKPGSGFDVLSQMQQQALHARAIVLTMSSSPLDISLAVRNGAMAYILTGSPLSEILLAIDNAVMSKGFLGEHSKETRGRSIEFFKSNTSGTAELSTREKQILKLVVRGNTSAKIGLELGLSPKTVETYRSRLRTKLELPDLPSMVRYAILTGHLEL